MKDKVSEGLRFLDLFGTSVKINYKKENKVKTLLGGLLTIIAAIMSIMLAWILGREIFLKENPLVIFRKVQKNISEVYLKDVPVFLDFLDKHGNHIDDPEKYIDFYAEQFFFVENGISFNTKRLTNFTFDKCKFNHGSEKFNELKSEGNVPAEELDLFICVKTDNETKIYNDYASVPSSYFGIGLRVCDNTTRSEGDYCANKHDLDDMWKKIYVRCTFLDYYIDPLKFEKPEEIYTYSKIQEISTEYYFRNYFQIQNTEVMTDIGLFSEELTQKIITRFNGIIPDIGNSNLSDPNLKYYISFESPILVDQYMRSYLKIPSVVGNMGGILNILFVIGKLICYRLNETAIYIDESKELVHFNEDCEDIDYEISIDKVKNDSLKLKRGNSECHSPKIIPYSRTLLIKSEGPEKNECKEETNLNTNTNTERLNFGKKEEIELKKSLPKNSYVKSSSNLVKLDESNFNKKEEIVEIANRDGKIDTRTFYIKNQLSLCDYVKKSTCRRDNPSKILYKALIDALKSKVDVRNFIKQSSDIEIIKFLLFGNHKRYDDLFNLKFPLDRILQEYKLVKNIKKEEKRSADNQKIIEVNKSLENKNKEEDLERELEAEFTNENQFQSEIRLTLELMKDNFCSKSLFD